VTQRLQPKRKRPPDPRYEDDPALSILVTAKRVGLSFQELDWFTLDDFVSFVELWTGDDSDAPRKSTQEDINAMFG
jgi:hypothetical protein